MYDVSSLIAFYYAAELGSITRAAKVLNISQAAMSKRVRRAESECGVMLVDRSRPGCLRITKEGLLIKQCVENMLIQYSDMLLELKGVSKTITVGYSTELFIGDLILLMSKFKLYHPDICFEVIHTTGENAIRMLRNGTCSHALVPYDDTEGDPFPGTGLGPILRMSHRIGVMFPEWVPLAHKQYVTADMLRYYDAIIPSDNGLMALFMNWLGHGPLPGSALRTQSIGGALLGAREGMGYAVLPMSRSSLCLRGLNLCPLAPAVHVRAAIISYSGIPRNGSVVLFDRFLENSITGR